MVFSRGMIKPKREAAIARCGENNGMRVFAECVSCVKKRGRALILTILLRSFLYVNFTTLGLAGFAALLSGVVVWLFLRGRGRPS